MIVSQRVLQSGSVRRVLSGQFCQRPSRALFSSTLSTFPSLTFLPTAIPSLDGKRSDAVLSSSFSATPLRFSSAATNDGGTDLNRIDLSQPQVSLDGSTVQVVFDHDVSSIFHATWLWENDPAFIHPSSGQRTRSAISCLGVKIQSAFIVSASSLDTTTVIHPQPSPGSFHPTGSVYTVDSKSNNSSSSMQRKHPRLLLRVQWKDFDPDNNNNNNDKEDTGISYYDMDWLERCRYDPQALDNKRKASIVSEKNALRFGEHLFVADFDSFISADYDHDETLYAFLSAVMEKGAAMLQNAPVQYNKQGITVAAVARRLGGGLSHGQLYGDTFDVQSKPDAHNIAYTTVGLEPHQDLAYYESPPGLQLLHCVKNTVTDGESKLIDALAAATAFRTLCPDLFDVLCDNEATFMKQRQGADMMYRRTHIRVDSNGDVVSVHWSPPFEGPLSIAPDRVNEYYIARAAFNRMLDKMLPADRQLIPMMDASTEAALQVYAQHYTWEQKLEPGEILVFNNERMLHARNAFEMGSGGERHLSGCYTNIDDTMNIYRMLRRKRLIDNKSLPIQLSGNGSSSVM